MDGGDQPQIGLAGLLAPIPVARFFDQYYEHRALHAPGADPARFTGLISSAAIDSLIAEQPFRQGELSMARAEPKLDPAALFREDGLADRGEVARLYQQGATLILPQLHARCRALADLCRPLEAEFSAPVQTNIYLTPPNAQGFQTHYDNHDVLVLQVEGAKRWRLYDAPAGTPYRGERFTPGRFAQTEPRDELVLQPGDVLYVPRGLMHDAVNEGEAEASLHITTGILAKTWADFVLEAVAEAALKSTVLRRSLPPGYARDAVERSVFEDQFKAALAEVEAGADLDAVIALFRDSFVTSRQPDTDGAIRGGAVQPGTQIRRRPLAAIHLADAGDHIALVAPGGPLSFDPPAEPALERFVAGETLTAADFAALGEEKARDAIARLIAYGAAVRV